MKALVQSRTAFHLSLWPLPEVDTGLVALTLVLSVPAGVAAIVIAIRSKKGESPMQVEDAKGRVTILRELGLVALAIIAGFAIVVFLPRLGLVDPTLFLLLSWGIPAILMYGLVTVARWYDRVLRIARPIGVTLGWSLAQVLPLLGLFAALGPLPFPFLSVIISVIFLGFYIWVSIRVTEWAVRAWFGRDRGE